MLPQSSSGKRRWRDLNQSIKGGFNKSSQRLERVYREPFLHHHCCTSSSTLGTTLFKVFLERTTKESMALTPSTMKNKRIECEIKVVAPARYGLEDLSVLRVPRRKHHHVARNVSVARKCFPAKSHWHANQRDPRHFFPLLDGVRRWSPQEFARHVVLSVGTTIFQGILKSMTQELTTLGPFTMMVTVTASPE